MDWPIAVDIVPTEEEHELATRHPNSYIYRLPAGVKEARGVIPDEAIVGRWQVNALGRIAGPFMRNPRYDSNRWPE